MESTSSSRIDQICKAFDPEIYRDITLNPLAAYAILMLDNAHIPTTIENISVALFKMFPLKFSLAGFSEYPDVARTNRVLLHMTPKYENLLSGNGSKGYVLNEKGKNKAIEMMNALKDLRVGSKKDMKVKAPRYHFERESKRLRDSIAFRRFKEGQFDKMERWEIFDLLGTVSYTPNKALKQRIEDLIQEAIDAEDQEIIDFLKSVRSRFSAIFDGSHIERKG